MIIDFDSKNNGGGKEPVVEALNVTANGSYTAPSGVDGYNPVEVNVPQREPVLESLSVTENGTYNAPSNIDGYNTVSVNVPEKTLNKASLTKEYTANGQYSIATPDGYDGISDVNITVNVASSGGGTADYSDMQFKSGLTELDTTKYNSIQWTDLSYMFSGCVKLTSLDLSSFNTSNVTDMNGMFQSCVELTSLNLSHFDTSNVTNMNSMFNYCDKLKSLDLSHFDTSNVTDMNYMFGYCMRLASLNISNWDTSNVTDISYMFYYCQNLKSLNISNLDTSKVTRVVNMFYNCSSLETINCDGLQLPDLSLAYIGLNRSPLTVDSIVGLLNALPQSTKNYSFQIGTDNIAKLSDDQKAIATNKGWTLV